MSRETFKCVLVLNHSGAGPGMTGRAFQAVLGTLHLFKSAEFTKRRSIGVPVSSSVNCSVK